MTIQALEMPENYIKCQPLSNEAFMARGPHRSFKNPNDRHIYYTHDWTIDWSTINLEELRKLPIEKCAGYRIDNSMGSVCFLDAPGYPSYFMQAVYNSRGDTPRYGPEYVIYDHERGNYHGVYYAEEWSGMELVEEDGHYVFYTPSRKKPATSDDIFARRHALLRKLWKPLPYEHERNWLWMMHTYAHLFHGYYSAKKDPHGGHNKFWGPRMPFDNENLENAWFIERFKNDLAEYVKVDPEINVDNHLAVRMIREFYPEHQPILLWMIKTPSSIQPDWETQNGWWETSSDKAPELSWFVGRKNTSDARYND